MQPKGIPNHGPLDLTQYVRHAFDDDKLCLYLAEDSGGDTAKELKFILQCLSSHKRGVRLVQPDFDHLNDKASDCSLERLLEQSGPGIVSGFQVSKRFEKSEYNLEKVGYMRFPNAQRRFTEGTFIKLESTNTADGDRLPQYEVTLAEYLDSHTPPKILSFDSPKNDGNAQESEGIAEESKVEYEESEEGADANEVSVQDGKGANPDTHAMVIIGGRRENNKLFFLLQNCWIACSSWKFQQIVWKNVGQTFILLDGLLNFLLLGKIRDTL